MCGIAGIFDKSGIDLSKTILISNVMRHRGPDDEGFLFVDSNSNVTLHRGQSTIKELMGLTPVSDYIGFVKLAFIHRRLSIIDLKPTGHQPMCIPEAGLYIVFNGEIYNYLELRAELEKLGHSFSTESDTEVILASYREWSEKCVEHFIGMWAFTILDQNKDILFCSRDRFGIKPFYYSEKKGFFAFGSEIKALLLLPQIKSVLDKTKAIEFLVNGNQNFYTNTFFTGINELPPGHNLIYRFTEENSSLFSYYKLSLSKLRDNISMDEAIREFSQLVNNSITLHLRSDVPVGTCLSGGLDSSTLVAFMARKKLPYGLNSFTASFPGMTIDEAPYIKELRELYNFNDFYTFPDFQKTWQEIDVFLSYQELPVQSTSMLAQWEVMKLAHQNSVKVLLDGQGMDEILGGYSEFVGSHLLGQITGGHLIKFIRTVKDLCFNYRTSLDFH